MAKKKKREKPTTSAVVNKKKIKDITGKKNSSSLNAKTLRDKKNKSVGNVAALRDIAEQKKTENKLKIYSNAIKNAYDSFVLTDLNGNVIDANESAIKTFGYSPGEILKLNMSQFTANPEDANKIVEEIKNKGKWSGEVTCIRKNKEEFPVVLSNSIVKDDKGNPTGIMGIFRDITEQKKIEASLEKTRKELAVIKQSADEASEFAESVINSVREPLISLDQDLRVVTVSRSFYEFFKVKPEETVGQLIYDLGNKQWDIPKLRELLETILTQKTTFDNYEVEHNFATIGRRVMLLNARQIQRALGKERIILLAIEDITDRRKAASQKFLNDMINSISDIFYVLDTDGKFILWNGAFEKVTGYSHEELSKMRATALFDKEGAANIAEAIKRAFEKGFTVAEESLLTKDGRKIPMFFSGSITNDLSGKPILCGTGKDITELKEKEKVLQASEERYKSFMEVTGQIGWTTPSDGIAVDMPAWREYSGQTIEEVKGWGWLNAVHPDDRERTAEVWNKAVAEKSTYETEYRIRRRDGAYSYFIARGIPSLREDGSIREWVGVCIDITERKKMEEELSLKHAELQKGYKKLEKFSNAAVDRELKMIELKKEINKLKSQLEKNE